MKLKHLFLSAIIALGLMACNNEEVPQVVDGAEATVSVKVVPSSNGPTVRFAGDLKDNEGLLAKGLETEYAVKKTQVWVFEANSSSLIGYGESNSAEVKEIPALAVDVDIMVVVNGGDLTLGAATTKNTLENLHAVMPTDIDGNGLLMTGNINKTLAAGLNSIGYEDQTGYTNLQSDPLKVLRVNARVALVDVQLQLPAEQVLFNGLSDLQVAMFNVAEKSKIFGAAGSLADNSAFLYGKQWTSTQGSYVGHNDNPDKSVGYLYDGLTAFPALGANAAYYYVTENDATNKMLLVLRAKPMLGNSEVTNLEDIYTDEYGYTYYPIKVNVDGLTPAGDGKVKRNTQYNISLIIKGLGNPEIDGNEKAWLDVKVEVQDWAQVDQNVEWK